MELKNRLPEEYNVYIKYLDGTENKFGTCTPSELYEEVGCEGDEVKNYQEYKLIGGICSSPQGCLCDSGYNSLKCYDENGFVRDITLSILHGDIILFNRNLSIGYLNAKYCPMCGKKLKCDENGGK